MASGEADVADLRSSSIVRSIESAELDEYGSCIARMAMLGLGYAVNVD